MAGTTQNIWEQPKPTTALTDKTPVANRPVWEKEKSVLKDIGNVAPSATRTGFEMLPAGPAESSGLIPDLVKWLISFSPYVNEQTLADFEAGKEAVLHPPSGISMDPREDFGLQSVRENITNPLLGEANPVQAETRPGKMVQRTLEISPSIFMGPGGIGQKALTTAAGGVGGPGARMIAEDLGASPAWQNAADIGASLATGVSPMVYNRMVNPNPIPASRQPAVDIMRTRNVPLSVGQQTGNERLLRRELNAGGPAAWDEQPAAFTEAATQTQGGFPPGTRQLSNTTMRAELDRMGNEFDRLAAASSARFDQQMLNDLTNIIGEYRQNPVVGGRVDAAVNGLFDHAMQNGGMITGEGYSRFRTHINDIIRNTDDAAEREAFMAVQDRVDAEIQASLPPDQQRDWRTVRAQYRNYLPIEYAKSGQGQGVSEGFITPQNLKTGIRNIEGRREVAAGERPMTELAEAGGTTMVKPNTSGTAENLRAQLAGLIPILGGGAGAAIGGMVPQLPQAATIGLGTLGAAAGYSFPKIRDAITRSNIGQRIAGRNLAPRIDADRAGLSSIIAATIAAMEREHGDLGRR